ncbi:hypothetical protein BG003_005093 [Podila horticola]|nr:hypothetical protein BG003_005093 [Podila horticola]
MPQKPTTGSSQKQPSQSSGATKMTSEAAARIQSTADRNPSSYTSTSGFKERAQSSAAKNRQGLPLAGASRCYHNL